ncbi:MULTISPECIES: MBL fold metallo-hydrolase [Haloferax]|uniref:MBL fold metallo-hydrolase n=3 Tax=Haloferax TaxID=2251 RepID=A0A6C0UTS0_HALVO|nr:MULTISPECIES: MBL fold metallo-hydrolase [Haloferax]ELZ88435.1 putative metallo-beta-lactamase family hydrolase [Haloferax alexandrinus JCM 10717]MBC9986625.1 MBL fold metallo-hydrolase [Haloferax sp. AS1]NLV03469.1 MBL fold metallo-hydrolase [Haloferax alexandrinus]QIB78925.1 MBL fold metallo-hydrolase [Haloferax alexandrinus]RDZ35427.1 MBL fold metallo-hydrolase [Haloferax sp. Atlit-24N]
MAIGDVEPVPDSTDLYYVDSGMYEVEKYGSVYLVDAERPALVDTGIAADREAVFGMLDEVGVDDLAYILPTHVHLDHAGGAGYLAERYPDATVMTHELGAPHLVDPSRLIEGTKAAVEDQWRFYDEPLPIEEDRVEGLTDGDEIDLGDRTLTVHHAPGHAPHQVMFHDDGDDVLFVGDALGIWEPRSRTLRQTSPPSQFHLQKALDDVRTIEDIDPETVCFGHFGPKPYDADLAEEYKRVLVEWVEAIRQKRAELGVDEAVIDHFVEHTQMDEVWGERKARDEERLNTRGVLGYLDYIGDDE